MITRNIHTLENARGSVYRNYNNKFEITMTETVGNDNTEVKAELGPNEIHDMYKSLRNSLIEGKIIRGKKQY